MTDATPRVPTGYKPQPKQATMHMCKANEILFGGAAGGGKSAALRAEALDWCMRIRGLQVYLFRRTFPEIEKNHILPSLQEFPRALGTFKKQDKRWEFNNGSMLHFCHCQYEQDVFNYQGAEIHILIMDELTTFTEFQYDYLRGRVRCTLDIPEKMRHKVPGIVCASNPGGIGHEFAKRRWVDPDEPLKLWRAPDTEGGMLRCYIPSRLEDNFVLMRTDPGYIHRLDALPEPYRTAYKEGRWDIFIGQAFTFNRIHHVIDPIPIPGHASIYMTMDWGFGAPFSIGWWWVDADGRLYRFSEWYGWNGTVNQGLRLEDSEIARGIKEREEALQITGKVQVRLAGPDCFNKKPDYRGGGQGPSTAEVFGNEGVYLTPGDPDRSLKIRQFRERLRVPADGTMPMLVVYRTCEQFIRTVPLIQINPKNVEYIIDDGEAHCLHGDTRIITDTGVKRIRDMVGTTGKVMTPAGQWVSYRDCRMTRKNSPLVEIEFGNGVSVTCTPDHQFLNDNGYWVDARNLTDESCHVRMVELNETEVLPCKSSSLTKQRKSSTASDIGLKPRSILAGLPVKEVRAGSTGMCGNITTGLLQRAITFITKTRTAAITRMTTLNYVLRPNIRLTTASGQIIPNGLLPNNGEPQLGTGAKRADGGTKSSMRSIARLYSIRRWSTNVLSAVRSLLLSPEQRPVHATVGADWSDRETATRQSEYVPTAGKPSWLRNIHRKRTVQGNVESLSPKESACTARTVSTSKKDDVYCLSIPHPHAFLLEGGIVSHNCFDEACHVCMARPMTFELPDPLMMPNIAEIYVDRIETEEEIDPMLELYGLDQEGEESFYAGDFTY